MQDSSIESFQLLDKRTGIEEVIDELRASNEEEIAADMQKLIDDVWASEVMEWSDTLQNKKSLSSLKNTFVKNRLSALSKSIDVLLDDEILISRLDLSDYRQLLSKIEEQERELNNIKWELEKIAIKENNEDMVVKYAEYLYKNEPQYYQKYITSRRWKIIQNITLQVKETGDVYKKIPILWSFYAYIVKKASEW